MMAIGTSWELDADTVSQLTSGVTVYRDVVLAVHWTCIAFDGPLRAQVSGVHKLPKPTDAAHFVDLAAIQALDDAARRDMIFNWAERIDPGFVAKTVAKVTALIEAQRAVPVIARVKILRSQDVPTAQAAAVPALPSPAAAAVPAKPTP